jgi:predicted PurR-regulated permease PerM
VERWLARHLGGSKRAAWAVTALVVLLILVPIGLLTLSLSVAVTQASAKLKESKELSDGLRAFFPSDAALSLRHLSPSRVFDLVRQHGSQAANAAKATFGALTAVVIGVVVYVVGVFECLVSGRRAYAWAKKQAFVSPDVFARLSAAFAETGRGLIVAIGGTALLQGAVATVGYALVGLPAPLLLGFVTTAAALIPSVGTAIVWVPATAVLLATGRVPAGIVLGLFGCVTSVVDNFVRPWLSKFGELTLPTFVTFVAMLGGLAAFGGLGIVLGPLFVRLAVEALDIWREMRASARAG